MQDEKKTNNDKAAESIANAASSIKTGLGMIANAAKGAGETLHPVLGKIGKVAGVIDKTIKAPEGNIVEKIVCSTANVVVQGVLVGKMIGEGAIHGAKHMPANAYAKAFGGIIGGATAATVVGPAVKPYGDAAQKACHAAFSKVFKRDQKTTAQNIVTAQHVRDKAINGFTPLRQHHQANTSSYRPYFYQYYSKPKPTTYSYMQEVRMQLMGLNLSLLDRVYLERKIESACSYMNFQMSYGSGYLCGLTGFSNSLSMAGLVSTYNNYNIASIVREAVRSSGEIGGVATEVSLITDLIDSEAHANATEYFLCFLKSQFPLSDRLVKVIERELAEVYFKHKTLPFFSLHFNNNGFSYPVLHPAFAGTLVGEIIAFLDYWMKGFLNGGIFDKEFLKLRHEIGNLDDNQLRAKLIDLKKYCKEYAKNVGYISLRELESRYGVKFKHDANSQYPQPYMASFRIIVSQEEISRHGNVLIPKPAIRIEYSIDLMPDYKEYLEKYHQEHGDYPEDYENIKRCYEIYAEEIKTKMPQLPFFKDYFQLLGLISAFCYANVTFEKMGKIAVYDEAIKPDEYAVPNLFPPLPLRYFQTYPLSMTLKELLSTEALQKEVNAAALTLFSDRNLRKMPDNIIQAFRNKITDFIRMEITKHLNPDDVFESNDEEIDRIVLSASRFLYVQVIQIHAAFTKSLQQMVTVLDKSEQQQIKKLPLPKKIITAQEALEKHVVQHKEQWQTATDLTEENILKAFTAELHEDIKKNFQTIKEDAAKELSLFTFICKQWAGLLSPEEKNAQQPEANEAVQQQLELLKQSFQNTDAQLEADFAKQIQSIVDTQTKLSNVKGILENNILLITQEIQRLGQLKVSELAKIPAHLHALNATIISAFTTPLDQEVARLIAHKTETQKKLDTVTERLTKIAAEQVAAPLEEPIRVAGIKKAIAEQQIAQFQALSTKGREFAIRDEALHLLDLFNQQNLKKLNHFTQVISQLSEAVLAKPTLANKAITKHYTHTSMSFTNKTIEQQKKQNYNLVGGCGVTANNIQTKPLEHGDDFCQALANAMQEQKEKTISFSFNGQDYMVYSLAVKDIANTQKPTAQNEAQTALLDLLKDEVEVESLTEGLCKESIDPCHANLMHYAASSLDVTRFNKLPGDALLARDKTGNLPLHFAAQSGNSDVVFALLSKNPTLVDVQNNSGATPLILAIQNNQIDAVKHLIAFKANCNYLQPNGLFPLYIALQHHFTEMALHLIDTVPELNINETIDSKMTALHLAIEADSLAVALKLIEKGAICTVRRKSDGFTALFCAVKKGHVELIKAMQAKGVSLQTLLESGKSVLHIAAETGQLASLCYLLDQGLDVDALTSDGNSALMLAIKAGFVEVANELASRAKLNQTNRQKQTASLLAIKYAMPTVSDILITRGEDPELLDDKGYSCVFYLVRNGEVQRFLALLEAGKVNLDLTYQGDNLLEVAAKYRQFLIVYPLLENNLRTKHQGLSLLEYAVIADEIGYVLRNAEGDFPKLLQLAAQHGSISCLTWLLKNNELSPNDWLELLKTALEHSNNFKAIALLVQRLPDVNHTLDKERNTALHLAVSLGSRVFVELLLSVGADVQLRNNKNQTPFHIAVKQKDNWLLKRLLKLTRPSQWPGDLWQLSNIKPSSAIAKTLAFYRKRLPSEVNAVFSPLVSKPISIELTTLIMTETLSQGLQQLDEFFEGANYEEAIEYLEENPDLMSLFKSTQGAHLLKSLFDNLHDQSKLLDKEQSEGKSSVDNLLLLFKNKGVNPALFIGENNVILSMLRAKSEKAAIYRHTVFSRHFPESIAPLATDNLAMKMSVVELALALNKVTLFRKLIGHCTQTDCFVLYGLHEAVLSNNYGLVQTLLSDYPVNSLNQNKQTPFMCAASRDNVRIMELLLAHGANVDRVDVHGQNSLHHALHHKAESAALFILPLLILKNQPDRYGITPLMLAASKGILSVLRFICEQGDFSQSVDNKGWNALHYAAFRGQVETAGYLKTQDFDLNAIENPESPSKSKKCKKRTPIQLAALKGHTEMVHQLIKLGANIEQEDVNQYTVFEYGAKSKNIDMLHYLQEHPLFDSKDRKTQLLFAASEVDNEHVVSQLILDDINCNATNESGCTALHLAAINNAGKVASLILQGKDVALDIIDQPMCTPLYYAAQFGHVWLIELLCEAGADVNYQNSTRSTALFAACEEGNTGAVAALLKHNADPSITNKEGLTPLAIASSKGHLQTVRALNNANKLQDVAGLLIRNGIIFRQATSAVTPESSVAALPLN